MDTIYDEMKNDVVSIQSILLAVELAANFTKESPIELIAECADIDQIKKTNSFLEKANKVNTSFRESHMAMPILRGSLLVSVISRFEAFIKDEVEELAIQATQKSSAFSKLPKAMQESLRRLSGEVIANPRKYRMDSRIGEIVENLAANWGEKDDASRINHFCLSITNENLRADSLAEMFSRLGVKDYWGRIAKSPDILVFFNTSDDNFAQRGAQKQLNDLIEMRNRLAHSPQNTLWPSHADLNHAIEFILALAKATSVAIPVFGLTFCKDDS